MDSICSVDINEYSNSFVLVKNIDFYIALMCEIALHVKHKCNQKLSKKTNLVKFQITTHNPMNKLMNIKST